MRVCRVVHVLTELISTPAGSSGGAGGGLLVGGHCPGDRQGEFCDVLSCSTALLMQCLPVLDGVGRCVQYVFALTEASGMYVAGRLWRSDDYGRAGSWKDITTVLPGTLK